MLFLYLNYFLTLIYCPIILFKSTKTTSDRAQDKADELVPLNRVGPPLRPKV